MLALLMSAVDLTPSESAKKTLFRRSSGFLSLTYLFRFIFTFFIVLPSIYLGFFNGLFFVTVSFSARLVSRRRPLGRLPRLPDAPEPSGTPRTISYDSYQFSLDHPYPSLTRSIPCSDDVLTLLYLGKTAYL